MGVRLILGRAGSGKTHHCLSRIREDLAGSLTQGPRLVLLVPEQAGLQMERALLGLSPEKALGRCEVLSFRRLAHKVLAGSTAAAPVVLSPLGRQMALRHLIQRHRGELREFARAAPRAGFMASLAEAVAELLQESAGIDSLEEAAAAAEESNHPSAPRLHDVALLYRAYLEYLGSDKVDPEGVLNLARDRIDAAPWLRGARIWIDGFAGLTEQQLQMIVALARRAERVDLALLLDSTGRLDIIPDDFSLFARTQRTWFTLARRLTEAGVPIEPPVQLAPSVPPRFQKSPALAQIEKSLFDVGAAPDTTPDDSIRLVQSRDRRSEVAAVARAVVDLVQSTNSPMRYRDIALVVRDLEPYHDLLSAELASHDIPFFIDRRRPTFHHPLIQLIRAVLAMHGDSPFDQAVAMLFKTGLAGFNDADADSLENYVVAHGFMAPENWDHPWTIPLSDRRLRDVRIEPSATLDAINHLRTAFRERIGEWWPTAAGRKGKPACHRWAERLVTLLERLDVRAGLTRWTAEAAARGDLDEAEEHHQVWTDFAALLDETVEALGDEPMTGSQFREVLEAVLPQLTLGLVPPTLDQVLVSSIERSRHPPVRAVFILGFSDGQFPAAYSEDPLLPDDDRAFLESRGLRLQPGSVSRLLDERMLAYIAVTRPSEFLWISYPLGDELGRKLEPSPYWPAIRDAIPQVEVSVDGDDGPDSISTRTGLAAWLAQTARLWARQELSSELEQTWLALANWARESGDESIRLATVFALAAIRKPPPARLAPAAVAALWPEPLATSVTAIERFAWCPYKHFANHGLKLAPRERHEIDEVDLGRLYHTVLEQFVHELVESDRTLRDLSPQHIADSVTRLCEKVVPEYAVTTSMNPREQRMAVWRGRRELRSALAAQKDCVGPSALRPKAMEKAFGLPVPDALPALELRTPGGRKVLLRGVIDRVDLLLQGGQSLAVVFDYKRRAGARLHLNEVYHGLAMQLLAYLLVLREHGTLFGTGKIVPGGAFYLPLLAHLQSVNHPSDAEKESFNLQKDFRPRGVVDFDWVDTLDPSLESGWSRSFSIHRTTQGEPGNLDASDAVPRGRLVNLLDHVRDKMGELADAWLSGEIAVAPARLGKQLPCTYCPYRSVCRFEYDSGQARILPRVSRTRVLEELGAAKEGSDA